MSVPALICNGPKKGHSEFRGGRNDKFSGNHQKGHLEIFPEALRYFRIYVYTTATLTRTEGPGELAGMGYYALPDGVKEERVSFQSFKFSIMLNFMVTFMAILNINSDNAKLLDCPDFIHEFVRRKAFMNVTKRFPFPI